MSREALPPIFRPFETGELDWPEPQGSVLLIGAEPGLRIPEEFPQTIAMVQGFRPDFLALQRAGRSVAPEAEGEAYDLALVVASRHRGESEARFVEAVRRLKPQGLLVMGGGKTDGISSLRKRLAAALPVEGHLAKNHGEAFWFRNGPEAASYADGVEKALADLPPVDGRFQTAPGMFSHDRIDTGSRLLAEHLPDNLKGLAADFCAGWGYLSVSLAQRCAGILRIDLFEADHAALQASGVNMKALAPSVETNLHWSDLAAEPVARNYDAIVMNPPFHHGRATDPSIGLAMIRAASNALKPGGKLFMVANRGLPYEPALKAGFARVDEIADASGFRVWKAKR